MEQGTAQSVVLGWELGDRVARGRKELGTLDHETYLHLSHTGRLKEADLVWLASCCFDSGSGDLLISKVDRDLGGLCWAEDH